MNTTIPIEEIKALGFDFYYREPLNPTTPITHGFFTDGKNIGYIATGRFLNEVYSISTVHKPCRECGTGFGLGGIKEITKEALQGAFEHHPAWARKRDARAVVKYGNWDEFHNYDTFHKQLKKA